MEGQSEKRAREPERRSAASEPRDRSGDHGVPASERVGESEGRSPSADADLDGPGADVGRLYDQYGASLYRYALMILADAAGAEDAIQQVFTALLSQRRQTEHEERYLRRAVRNECYSVLRRRGRSAGEGPLLELAAPQAPPDERIALERAIRELPADQREVLHLHVFEGRTFQEIADFTGESINTCASRYRYAVAKLKEMLIR